MQILISIKLPFCRTLPSKKLNNKKTATPDTYCFILSKNSRRCKMQKNHMRYAIRLYPFALAVIFSRKTQICYCNIFLTLNLYFKSKIPTLSAKILHKKAFYLRKLAVKQGFKALSTQTYQKNNCLLTE